jgi:hypothetical protein
VTVPKLENDRRHPRLDVETSRHLGRSDGNLGQVFRVRLDIHRGVSQKNRPPCWISTYNPTSNPGRTAST